MTLYIDNEPDVVQPSRAKSVKTTLVSIDGKLRHPMSEPEPVRPSGGRKKKTSRSKSRSSKKRATYKKRKHHLYGGRKTRKHRQVKVRRK